jgi:hypothetical protein
MKLIGLPLVVAAVVALAACGESKEDKAMNTVCSARSDIKTQVDHLKGLTVSTATVDDVQKRVKAIGDDLSRMKNAQGDLKGDRKQEVQTANQAFASQIKAIVSNVGRSLSLRSAKTQLQTALQQLVSAYRKNLAPIDCS